MLCTAFGGLFLLLHNPADVQPGQWLLHWHSDTLSEGNFPHQISVWRKPAGPPHLVERIDQLGGLRAWGEWARRHPLHLLLKSRMHSWTPEDTYLVWVTVWRQIHSSMRTPILRLAAILQYWQECITRVRLAHQNTCMHARVSYICAAKVCLRLDVCNAIFRVP